MNVLGLIPARGGSKRVPRKNARMLHGQPLVAWSICCALHSQAITDVAVSTEDAEIRGIAFDWGVQTIDRPPEMATDEATLYPVMLHALDNLELPYDYLVLLHPTSPFRAPCDIDLCVELAERMQVPLVVTRQRGGTVPNGAVYVARTDWLRDAVPFIEAPLDAPAMYHEMPMERSLDIDTMEDFARAEGMAA